MTSCDQRVFHYWEARDHGGSTSMRMGGKKKRSLERQRRAIKLEKAAFSRGFGRQGGGSEERSRQTRREHKRREVKDPARGKDRGKSRSRRRTRSMNSLRKGVCLLRERGTSEDGENLLHPRPQDRRKATMKSSVGIVASRSGLEGVNRTT